MLVLGPKFLRAFLRVPADELISQLPDTNSIRYVGQIIFPNGTSWFNISYNGTLGKGGLITDSDSGLLRLAVADPQSDERIFVFDKKRNGWDALFGEGLQHDQPSIKIRKEAAIEFRPPEVFQIAIVANYNSGTREELLSESENGKVTLPDGRELALQDAFDDAFDSIEIFLFDKGGRKLLIISEELA